jgi:DNA-binding beta-propeller fold protein YncE
MSAHLSIQTGVYQKLYDFISGRVERSIVSPYGISVDSAGRMYIVDTYLKMVHVFDCDGNTYFSFPSDRTVFESPIDIAVDDKSGKIYVTDSKQGIVRTFNDFGKTSAGVFGDGLFKRPTGIAVNQKTSELLVVDTLQSQVVRFDLLSLKLKGSFGGDGSTAGMLHYPTNIFVTQRGRIIVADSLNFRVQVFSPEGDFLMVLGEMGHSPGSFSRPKGVAADSDGNIYVVDSLFDNIQMFDPSGNLLMAFGEHGVDYGEFWLPTGIYIDDKDRIYVSDSYNKRVQMFKYMKDELFLK